MSKNPGHYPFRKQKSPETLFALGLVGFTSRVNQDSMIPELATRQARGIMVDVLLRLSRLIQFGKCNLRQSLLR